MDPARVSPQHLPALAQVAADLDGITAPVRIVNATDLPPCVACPDHDLPRLDAIATVIARDVDAFGYRAAVCALHLRPEIGYHTRRGHTVVVEVPASGGRQWFERTDRETYYALDEAHGVAVVRGMWDTWTVVTAADGLGADHALAVFPWRSDAECWAQDHAARVAADAYEAASAAVALPVVTVSGVAA